MFSSVGEGSSIDNIQIARPQQIFSELPLLGDHHDPYDRLIVAQAISDRIPVVSSDHKFALYERYGLDFVYNER